MDTHGSDISSFAPLDFGSPVRIIGEAPTPRRPTDVLDAMHTPKHLMIRPYGTAKPQQLQQVAAPSTKFTDVTDASCGLAYTITPVLPPPRESVTPVHPRGGGSRGSGASRSSQLTATSTVQSQPARTQPSSRPANPTSFFAQSLQNRGKTRSRSASARRMPAPAGRAPRAVASQPVSRGEKVRVAESLTAPPSSSGCRKRSRETDTLDGMEGAAVRPRYGRTETPSELQRDASLFLPSPSMLRGVGTPSTQATLGDEETRGCSLASTLSSDSDNAPTPLHLDECSIDTQGPETPAATAATSLTDREKISDPSLAAQPSDGPAPSLTGTELTRVGAATSLAANASTGYHPALTGVASAGLSGRTTGGYGSVSTMGGGTSRGHTGFGVNTATASLGGGRLNSFMPSPSLMGLTPHTGRRHAEARTNVATNATSMRSEYGGSVSEHPFTAGCYTPLYGDGLLQPPTPASAEGTMGGGVGDSVAGSAVEDVTPVARKQRNAGQAVFDETEDILAGVGLAGPAFGARRGDGLRAASIGSLRTAKSSAATSVSSVRSRPLVQVPLTPFRELDTPLRSQGPTGAFKSLSQPMTQDESKSWEEQAERWVSDFNQYIAEVDAMEL